MRSVAGAAGVTSALPQAVSMRVASNKAQSGNRTLRTRWSAIRVADLAFVIT